MLRRLALVLGCAILVAGPAWGQGVDDRKRIIDEKIARLQDRIDAARQREGVLTSEISTVTARIRDLEGQVDTASARLLRLERELDAFRARLARVQTLLEYQTQRLELLRRQHAIAVHRLNERLIEIYESHDPSAFEVLLSASSFTDALDQLDYLTGIGQQDRRIAKEVAAARGQMRDARARTAATKERVQAAARAVEQRAAEQQAERDRLVAVQDDLADARSTKEQTLAAVRTNKEEYLHEVEGLEAQSATLAAQIRSAQQSARFNSGGSDDTPSIQGLVWPVAGPVTSGFGWRWGRMHEGIDIGAPTGAPIQAAAAGTVIYTGWLGGYGNLVVIDHGGGLATAYAHQSAIASGVGQVVAQGQTIGYVGCTGHCFGSHLHFEVRVNGTPVDPLGYL